VRKLRLLLHGLLPFRLGRPAGGGMISEEGPRRQASQPRARVRGVHACGDGLTDKATSKPEPGVALRCLARPRWRGAPTFPAETSQRERERERERREVLRGSGAVGVGSPTKGTPRRPRLAPCPTAVAAGWLGGSSEKQRRQRPTAPHAPVHMGIRTDRRAAHRNVRASTVCRAPYESTTTVAAGGSQPGNFGY